MADLTIHGGNVQHIKPQCADILQHLKSGKSITGLEASIMFGVGHLPRRILDLKEAGIPIDSEFIPVKKSNGKIAHVKKYFYATTESN